MRILTPEQLAADGDEDYYFEYVRSSEPDATLWVGYVTTDPDSDTSTTHVFAGRTEAEARNGVLAWVLNQNLKEFYDEYDGSSLDEEQEDEDLEAMRRRIVLLLDPDPVKAWREAEEELQNFWAVNWSVEQTRVFA